MDLLEKFSAVEVRPANCMTEADRQFCQQQQTVYRDAVEGFYQIAALWMDICANQKAALSSPENHDDSWRKKYLESLWWPEITVERIVKHIFRIHREFIAALVSYLNTTYFLSLDAAHVANALLPNEPAFDRTSNAVDWSAFPPVVLRYEDAVELILTGFNGRTFEEQAPYELVENCRRAAWKGTNHTANFEQKNAVVKFLSGACSFGYYNHYDQWHVNDNMKNVLKGLAHFETGGFGQYPDGIDDLLSDTARLWYDLWEFEGCKKLKQIKMFKNGRMDIRFTSEGYAREFVAGYLGTAQ